MILYSKLRSEVACGPSSMSIGITTVLNCSKLSTRIGENWLDDGKTSPDEVLYDLLLHLDGFQSSRSYHQ